MPRSVVGRPHTNVQLTVFVEKEKLVRTFSSAVINRSTLASSVRRRHSSGVRNTNRNLSGLAILARNVAIVIESSTLLITG